MNTHVSLGMKYPLNVMFSVVLHIVTQREQINNGYYVQYINVVIIKQAYQWGIVKGM